MHPHTSRTWAYLQAYYVDQRLVSDVDVAQDLGDWHPGDQQVERHKQREDWSKPVRGEREKRHGTGFKQKLEQLKIEFRT